MKFTRFLVLIPALVFLQSGDARADLTGNRIDLAGVHQESKAAASIFDDTSYDTPTTKDGYRCKYKGEKYVVGAPCGNICFATEVSCAKPGMDEETTVATCATGNSECPGPNRCVDDLSVTIEREKAAPKNDFDRLEPR